MHRSSNPRQSPSSMDNSRRLDALMMRPPPQPERQSPRISNNERDDNSNRTIRKLITDQPFNPPPRIQSPSRASRIPNDDWDDNNNRTIKKLIADQPFNPPRTRSPSHTSLKSMVIEGQWSYRDEEDDRHRLKSIGVKYLVDICHDIMRETYESMNLKRSKTQLSKHEPLTFLKIDKFKRLTDNERSNLRQAKVFHLMNIVYEAASSSASISQLVRIWHEATDHNLNRERRRSKKTESQPLISYEKAFQHLTRTPNDHLLQIVLQGSLARYSRNDLRRLGDRLGIDRDQFDMGSIRNSANAFRDLIQILRGYKKREKHIDIKKLPYEPKKKRGLYANVSGTRFPLVCQAVDVSGFYISPDPDFTCNLLWNDTLISMDIVSALKPYQKVNHFPTMNEISRKDLLAKNYDRLSNRLPKDYNFAPRTWILPSEYDLWYSYASNKSKNDSTVYILKPTNAAMGQGIAIHCDYKQIKPMNDYIIQEYIREPYLIDGFKFDLRVYALITSCDPLRVFIFNNGLVRICSKKYVTPDPRNALDLLIHLTNYPVSDEDDEQKKHTMKYLLGYLKEQKQDGVKIWHQIEDIVLKTIFLAEPHLLTAYRKCRPGTLKTSESVCFELLGFDILLDKNLKPWIIEVNRCSSFDASEQIEFDLKLKLLFDTFDLVRFRASDRKKSVAIEKIEAQHRLYNNLGREIKRQTDELTDLKEKLHNLQRERMREVFESHHARGYIRLFPVNDEKHMELLTKCFEILSPNKKDTSWKAKYIPKLNEEELVKEIVRLEEKKPPQSSKPDRPTSSIDFTFESSDEDSRSRSQSPRSDRMKKLPPPPPRTTDSPIRQVSTQTPADIVRSVSLSSMKIPKRHSMSPALTGTVTRARAESLKAPPGIPAARITEKKTYVTEPSSSSEHPEYHPHHHHRSESPRSRRSNDKSQIVTYSSIIRETRQYQEQKLAEQAPIKDVKEELQLTKKDFHRLHQLTLEEMNKLCIHYPNKSDKETYRICTEIIENWDYYQSDIGRFWLGELDTEKRESVIEIVWNNVQQVMKKVCIVDDLIHQLPLNRSLLKLKRRLLANHGQPFWDACQNRHSSWESLFVKSTNSLSPIELNCCYRYVGLCQEALFVVYRCSINEKNRKQKHIHQQLTIMVKS